MFTLGLGDQYVSLKWLNMKNNSWDPTKRNRNIGTEKSGYSQNNKFVIPDRWQDSKIFWESIVDPVIAQIRINKHEMTMFIEPTLKGYVHAVTPEDIVKILNLVELEHLKEIELIVLRQPKKKEEILKPVWGRLVYYADLGRYSGSAIYLEAVQMNYIIKWGNKINAYERKELNSLEADGHTIKKIKKGYDIYTNPETVRNTQLFRTIPHEIGHAVDYLKNVLEPSIEADTEAEYEYITNAYRSKSSLDREEYAHRYAREFFSKWSTQGSLPFKRIYNEKKLKEMGADPEWFNFNIL